MERFKAKKIQYAIIRSNPNSLNEPIPLLRDTDGRELMYKISPHHGRSFVVGTTDDGKYIISKGNGLSYSQYAHLYSAEFGDNTWGLLLKKDAIRDFEMGMEIAGLGIRTNMMEYVLELNKNVLLTNGHQITPILLQYTVECPYRICDATYMTKKEIYKQVEKWGSFNKNGYKYAYIVAAELLISNLYKLHTHNILHNAIHPQNYTWALELLDFELACSSSNPYDKEEEQSKVKDLFNREIIQTYEIINHIAWCLGETIDYKIVDNLFNEYGFDISQMNIK